MGEITDLIGIYGAIEAAVISDAERRTAVAQVLPIYGDEPARRQRPQVVRAARGVDQREERRPARTHRLRPSMRRCETSPRSRRSGACARRMMAIAALARAIPAYRDRSNNKGKLAQRALRVEGLVEDADRSASLHGAALHPRLPGRRPLGRSVVGEHAAGAAGLIAEKPAFIGHRPCTSGLVRVPVAVPGQGTSSPRR